MPIIRKGVVVSGEYLDWKIFVDDDRDGGTGGYYLFLEKNEGERFDYWFEHETGLQAQLVDFDVEWMASSS